MSVKSAGIRYTLTRKMARSKSSEWEDANEEKALRNYLAYLKDLEKKVKIWQSLPAELWDGDR